MNFSKLSYTELKSIMDISETILNEIQQQRLIKRDNFFMEDEKVKYILVRKEIVKEFSARIDKLLTPEEEKPKRIYKKKAAEPKITREKKAKKDA